MKILFILLLSFLSACSGVPFEDSDELNKPLELTKLEEKELQSRELKHENSRYMRPGKLQKSGALQPATMELLRMGRQKVEKFEYEAAAALAERALRIEPYRSEIYMLLAEVQIKLRHYSQARQLILKGLSYTDGNDSIANKFNQLLRGLSQ